MPSLVELWKGHWYECVLETAQVPRIGDVVHYVLRGQHHVVTVVGVEWVAHQDGTKEYVCLDRARVYYDDTPRGKDAVDTFYGNTTERTVVHDEVHLDYLLTYMPDAPTPADRGERIKELARAYLAHMVKP